MARPVRIHRPNHLYLIQVRARPGTSLFFSEKDRELFLDCLGVAAEPDGVVLYAFALIENSALLFVRSGSKSLSGFVHRTQAGYFNRLRAQNSNRNLPKIHDRHRSILVEESCFMDVLRRVHIAPIIGEHWSNESESRKWGEVSTTRWTSFPIFTGSLPEPYHFSRQNVLDYFKDANPRKPEDAFYLFIVEAVKNFSTDILDDVVAMSLLGSEEFVQHYYEVAKGRRQLIKPERHQPSVARKKAEKNFKSLLSLVAAEYSISPAEVLRTRTRRPARKILIELAMKHALDENGIKGLGERLGVSGSAVAHIHRSFAVILADNEDLQHTFDSIEKKFLEQLETTP